MCYWCDLQLRTKFSHCGDPNEGNADWKCWSSLPFVTRFMFPVLRRQAVSQPEGVTALPIDTCKGYTAIFISVFGLNRLKTRDCAICVTTFHGKVTTDVGVGWMRGRRSITGKDKYSSPPTPCPDRLWGRVQRPIL